MANLIPIGIFLAGLGIFFVGVALLWVGSMYEDKVKEETNKLKE